MNQPALFEPADLDDAQTEIGDVLDRWQRTLSPEDWATVVATVTVLFRLTTLEEEPKKPKRKVR